MKQVESGWKHISSSWLFFSLFLDIFHTTQTSRQSRQLQRTKLLTVSFSACRILMRRRCHGKHQQLSRQEKTLLFCRPPWKPPHTHTRARHAWRLTSDYSVWENRKGKRGDEDSGAHLELLVSLSSPVERLDVAAVNHQSFITVSDGVSVLLHWQVTQRPVNTHTHTHTQSNIRASEKGFLYIKLHIVGSSSVYLSSQKK